MPLAGKVQVVVLVAQEIEVELLDQFLEVQDQLEFSAFLLAEQVYAEDLVVEGVDFREVLRESLFGLLVAAVELHLCVDPTLLPESRHRAPDLQVRKTVVVYEDDLFGLTEIGDVALRVYTPGIVAGPALLPRPPGYQKVLDLLA